jgi:hypothetical protein
MAKEKTDKIIANVCVRGDRSVGMFPIHLKITIEGLSMKRDIEDPMQDGRREFRDAIAKLFYEFLDYGRVGVSFSDECIDCGSLLAKRKKHECPLAAYWKESIMTLQEFMKEFLNRFDKREAEYMRVHKVKVLLQLKDLETNNIELHEVEYTHKDAENLTLKSA